MNENQKFRFLTIFSATLSAIFLSWILVASLYFQFLSAMSDSYDRWVAEWSSQSKDGIRDSVTKDTISQIVNSITKANCQPVTFSVDWQSTSILDISCISSEGNKNSSNTPQGFKNQINHEYNSAPNASREGK